MNERLIQRLADIFRGSGLIPTDYLLFIFQLVAWVRVSKQGKLPQSLTCDLTRPPKDTKELLATFRQIVDSSLLGVNSFAFNYIPQTVGHLTAGQILQALELADEANLQPQWSAPELANYLAAILGKHTFGIPDELSNLMQELACIEPEQMIYLPFEHSFQLTSRAQQKSEHVYSETIQASPLPWLLNLLSDKHGEVYIGDSLTKPGYVVDGKLAQFDTSIAFPPLNVRYDASLAQQDQFARFSEQTSASSVLSVRHLLSRTKGRIVVAIPNGLLFSPGAERSLRESLLSERQIEAVIALPQALLPGTTAQFCLLVLNAGKCCNQVSFIDGANESLFTKDGKGRATLTGWKIIADLFLQQSENDIVRRVSVEEVIANDAQLQVSRYCLNADTKIVESLLNKYSTALLEDLVTFIRPIPASPQEGVIEALEVGPADFPEYGYAEKPGRCVKLAESAVMKGRKQFLQSLDILVAIKGSVGKLAIVPPEITAEKNEQQWVAGQSCIVLRVNDKGIIHPLVLFTFLKSEAGQLLLKQIVSGAAVPLIQLRELEKIKIPLPGQDEQSEIVTTFERIVAVEQNINALRGEQQQIVSRLWKA